MMKYFRTIGFAISLLFALTVTIDFASAAAPVVTITSPTPGIITSITAITFTSDIAGTATCGLSGAFNSAPCTSGMTFADLPDFATLPNGMFSLAINVTDSTDMFNIGSSTVDLIKNVAIAAPVITSPAYGATVIPTDVLSFTTGYPTTTLCIFGTGMAVPCTSDATFGSYDFFNIMPDGSFTLSVEDGNGQSISIDLVKNGTPLVLTIADLVAGDTVASATILSFTTGILPNPYCLIGLIPIPCTSGLTFGDLTDFAGLPDGQFTLTIADQSGMGQTISIDLIKNGIPPVLTIIDPIPGTVVTATTPFSFTAGALIDPQCEIAGFASPCNPSGMTFNDIAGFGVLSDGIFTLTIHDLIGGQTATVSLVKNGTPIPITITSPANGASVSGTETLLFTAFMLIDPQCSVGFSLTPCIGGVTTLDQVNGFTSIPDGPFDLTVSASNGIPTTNYLIKDTVGPTATINNVNLSSVTIAGIDVVSYQYTIDGGAISAVTPIATLISSAGLTNGTHALAVYGIDLLGNVQAIPTTLDWSVINTVSISGAVKYYDGIKVVPTATVILEDNIGTQLATTVSDINGLYQFTGITTGGNYVVRVLKADTALGLSAADQIGIGRHIVGLAFLSSIYKTIAGDVNSSGALTAADQIGIGRFIVGLGTLLSGPWKFYSSSAVLDAANYLTTGLNRTYTNLTADMINQDFVGIKMGDVNNSW